MSKAMPTRLVLGRRGRTHSNGYDDVARSWNLLESIATLTFKGVSALWQLTKGYEHLSGADMGHHTLIAYDRAGRTGSTQDKFRRNVLGRLANSDDRKTLRLVANAQRCHCDDSDRRFRSPNDRPKRVGVLKRPRCQNS